MIRAGWLKACDGVFCTCSPVVWRAWTWAAEDSKALFTGAADATDEVVDEDDAADGVDDGVDVDDMAVDDGVDVFVSVALALSKA
jgi:hypothetical protein